MSLTSIEWTDRTWNPVTGCTKISAGCDNCYADLLANSAKLRDVYLRRLPVVDTQETREDPFAVRIWPERVSQPGSWRAAAMVFVNSMSDLFHADVPEHFLREVVSVMLRVDRHIYQVLTKRPGRAAAFFRRNADLLAAFGGRLPWWVWIGASVEDQPQTFRIRQLGEVPATVRFLSCEPLLGGLDGLAGDLGCPSCGGCGAVPDAADFAVTCTDCGGTGLRIHWVIGGGESGATHRPLVVDHARTLRDECSAAGVPFFFKQHGGRTPKSGGRLLDGVLHDGWPAHPRVREWKAARAGAAHG